MSNLTIKIDNCYIIGEPDFEALKTTADENQIKVSSRNIAGEIIEEFEKVLDKYEIDIPSGDEPDGNKNRARLYGLTYFNLLDEVEAIVANALETVRDVEDVDIVKGVFY